MAAGDTGAGREDNDTRNDGGPGGDGEDVAALDSRRSGESGDITTNHGPLARCNRRHAEPSERSRRSRERGESPHR